MFYSKAVEDADDKNVVELYELRYRDAAAARRVQSLLTFPAIGNWDWNYHPFSAAYHGRSVFVIEGRWRAWSAFKAVAAHFAAPILGKERPLVLPVCGPSPEGRPLFSAEAAAGKPALSVYALGFSPTGRFAWLEQRTGGREGGVEWSIQLVDLIDDHPLPGKKFQVAHGVSAICAQHGAEAASLLHDASIVVSPDLALQQPTAGQDPTGVELRPAAGGAAVEVVLRGAGGEKKLGSFTPGAGADPASVLGFLRSPFEPRVAVVVRTGSGSRGGGALRFFGGRLDKRWTPPPAPRPD